jgi:hypothetical protein
MTLLKDLAMIIWTNEPQEGLSYTFKTSQHASCNYILQFDLMVIGPKRRCPKKLPTSLFWEIVLQYSAWSYMIDKALYSSFLNPSPIKSDRSGQSEQKERMTILTQVSDTEWRKRRLSRGTKFQKKRIRLWEKLEEEYLQTGRIR